MFRELCWIAVAGAAGSLARYGLSSLVQSIGVTKFPLGTLCVNALGCYLFGLVWSLAERQVAFSSETKMILLVGFMGAFTTFSTFAHDTGQFIKAGQYGWALLNIMAQNMIGLAAVFLGMHSARWGS